jgi:hypothetical protein
MRKLFAAFGFACLVGCASYTTTQTDNSYEKTNQVRAITTKVTVRTFWAAKSDLAKSAVVNTDKSQSSRVGSLNSSATNNVIQDLTELAKELKKP